MYHLLYSHRGVTFGANFVNVYAVLPEGLPEFFIKNMPPIPTEDEIIIDEPRISFGELTAEYVVDNSNEQRQ